MQVQKVNNQQSFTASVTFAKDLPEIYEKGVAAEHFFEEKADKIIENTLKTVLQKKQQKKIKYISKGSTSTATYAESRFRASGGDTFILTKSSGAPSPFSRVIIEHGRKGASGRTFIDRNEQSTMDKVFDQLENLLQEMLPKKPKAKAKTKQ